MLLIMKFLCSCTCLLIGVLWFARVTAQNDYGPVHTSLVKTVTSSYVVSDYGTASFWRNQLDTLHHVKPNYNIDELSLSGLDLKGAVVQVEDQLRAILSPKQKEVVRSAGRIVAEVVILGNGRIKAVTFMVSNPNRVSVQEIELLEKVVKSVSVNMKDPQRYKNVNFMHITLFLRTDQFL